MTIGESINLRSLDGQQLPIQLELDRVFRNVAEHSLVIIDGLVLLDDQQVAIGLPGDQPRPFGIENRRFRPELNASNDVCRDLQHIAPRQIDPRPVAFRQVLKPKDGRTVGQFDDDA